MGLVSWLRRRRAPAPERPRRASRRWDAGGVTRLMPATAGPRPIDADIRNAIRWLVSRARHEAQNSDHVRQFLRLCRTNIVGHQGVILQSRARDPDGTPDRLASEAIEESWREWGRYGSPEVTGTQSWFTLQSLLIESVCRDGELLLVEHRSWRGNAWRYALQIWDPLALDTQLDRDLGNGRRIRMGVELDELRRPIAYHLLAGQTQTEETYTWAGQRYQRVPADRVIHRFLPEWAWQTRGVSPLATSLLRLNMLRGYEEAELTAARTAAAKMGFYVSPDGTAPVAGGVEDDEQHDVTPVREAEPGHFDVLPEGYDLRSWDPQHPSGQYGEFVRSCLRSIAAGLGVSYAALSADYSDANYSSMRQAAIDERAAWMALQRWFVESVLEPIYQHWIESAVLAGAIEVAGRPLRAERIDKYRRVAWQPRRWPWVDPQKEMAANALAVRLRVRSLSDIIREQGRDPDEVWDEIAAERARLEELGIPLDAAIAAATGGTDASA